MQKNVVWDGGGMGENVLGRVVEVNEIDSVSDYRYISLHTLQSFRVLQASSQIPLFFV